MQRQASMGGSSRDRSGGGDASSPAFLPTPKYRTALDHVQGLPETASIALFLGAIAPTLRVRPFTLRDLELALAYPELPASVAAAVANGSPAPPSTAPAPGAIADVLTGSELLDVLLSRLLIDEKTFRVKLAVDEGMGWHWVNRLFRETVRAWYRRRALLRARVDATVAAAEKSPFLHPPRKRKLRSSGEDEEEGAKVSTKAEPQASPEASPEGGAEEGGIGEAGGAGMAAEPTLDRAGPHLTGYKRKRLDGADELMLGEGVGGGSGSSRPGTGGGVSVPAVGEVRFLPLTRTGSSGSDTTSAADLVHACQYTLASRYSELDWVSDDVLSARAEERAKMLMAAVRAGSGKVEVVLGYRGKEKSSTSGLTGLSGLGSAQGAVAPMAGGQKAGAVAGSPATLSLKGQGQDSSLLSLKASPSPSPLPLPASPAPAPAALAEGEGVGVGEVGQGAEQEGDGEGVGVEEPGKPKKRRRRAGKEMDELRRVAAMIENVPAGPREGRRSAAVINFAKLAEGEDDNFASRRGSTSASSQPSSAGKRSGHVGRPRKLGVDAGNLFSFSSRPHKYAYHGVLSPAAASSSVTVGAMGAPLAAPLGVPGLNGYGLGRGPMSSPMDEDPGIGEDGMPLLRKPAKFIPPQFDETVEERDIIAALAPSMLSTEAGEEEVAELFEWDSLLEPLDAVGAQLAVEEASGEGLVPGSTTGTGPLVVAGRVIPGLRRCITGGTDMNPLSSATWSELPLPARLKLLQALIQVRITWQDDDLWEALTAAMASNTDAAERAAQEAPDASAAAAAYSATTDRFPFRMRALGWEARSCTRYLTFPTSLYKSETRIYAEREVRMRSGRLARTWEVAGHDLDSLRAILETVERAEREGRRTATSVAAAAAASASNAALLTQLHDAIGAIAEKLEAFARRQERDARWEAAFTGPRRTSNRHVKKRGDGEGIEGEVEGEGDGEYEQDMDLDAGAGGASVYPGPVPSDEHSGAAHGLPVGVIAAIQAGQLPTGLPAAITRPRRGRGPPGTALAAPVYNRDKIISLLEHMPHAEKVAAIAELIDSEPEYLRYAGMPLQAAILGNPGPEDFWSEEAVLRVFDMKKRQITEETARLRRAHKEWDRRLREREQAEKVQVQVKEKEEIKSKEQEKLAAIRAARLFRREMGMAATHDLSGLDLRPLGDEGRVRMRVLGSFGAVDPLADDGASDVMAFISDMKYYEDPSQTLKGWKDLAFYYGKEDGASRVKAGTEAAHLWTTPDPPPHIKKRIEVEARKQAEARAKAEVKAREKAERDAAAKLVRDAAALERKANLAKVAEEARRLAGEAGGAAAAAAVSLGLAGTQPEAVVRNAAAAAASPSSASAVAPAPPAPRMILRLKLIPHTPAPAPAPDAGAAQAAEGGGEGLVPPTDPTLSAGGSTEAPPPTPTPSHDAVVVAGPEGVDGWAEQEERQERERKAREEAEANKAVSRGGRPIHLVHASESSRSTSSAAAPHAGLGKERANQPSAKRPRVEEAEAGEWSSGEARQQSQTQAQQHMQVQPQYYQQQMHHVQQAQYYQQAQLQQQQMAPQYFHHAQHQQLQAVHPVVFDIMNHEPLLLELNYVSSFVADSAAQEALLAHRGVSFEDKLSHNTFYDLLQHRLNLLMKEAERQYQLQQAQSQQAAQHGYAPA